MLNTILHLNILNIRVRSNSKCNYVYILEKCRSSKLESLGTDHVQQCYASVCCYDLCYNRVQKKKKKIVVRSKLYGIEEIATCGLTVLFVTLSSRTVFVWNRNLTRHSSTKHV